MERTMMRTAAVNDVTLEYVERRASEPVVLIQESLSPHRRPMPENLRH